MREPHKGLWHHPNFMRLWVGKTISDIGNGITGIALPLTAVLVLSASSAQMGILNAVSGASILIFSLFAGVWVDRLPRRPILIVTDIGRTLLLMSIPVAAWLGALRIEQLYIVGACVGLLTVFFNVADQSFLPTLVEPKYLVEGNSKLGASASLAEIAGPALAGPLVQLVTAPIAILFDAFSFLVSALCMGLIRTDEPRLEKQRSRQSVWREIAEGMQVIVRSSVLRTLALSAAIFEFFGNFIGTLYILYIVRVLHAPPFAAGLLVAAGGISALMGAFVAERIANRIGIGNAISWSLFGYGVIGLLLPLAQGPVIIVLSILFIGQFAGDIFVEIYLINEISLRQSLIPSHLLGRANASMQFLTGGVGPIGALLAGVLGTFIGIRITILIGVLGVILAGLCLLLSPVRKTKIPEVHVM